MGMINPKVTPEKIEFINTKQCIEDIRKFTNATEVRLLDSNPKDIRLVLKVPFGMTGQPSRVILHEHDYVLRMQYMDGNTTIAACKPEIFRMTYETMPG